MARHLEQALTWYRSAAGQGSAQAQDRLGDGYRDGSLGLPKDAAEAAKWYRKAADQGFAAAQYELARCYFAGAGVPQDYVRAHMWANVAVTGLAAIMSVAPPFIQDLEKQAAGLRDKLTTMMTSQQLADAQRLAREWKVIKVK